MQRGVINVLKDIWVTLKKEVKGPEIKSKTIQTSLIQTNNYNFKFKINLLIKKIFDKIVVKDMNQENTVQIKEASFSKKIEMGVLLLKDKLSVSNGKINIEKILTKVKIKKISKIENEVFNIKINMNKTNQIKTKVPKINIMIKDGKEKILEIPKRIKGKSIYYYKKTDLENILKKLKKSLGTKNISDYNIEGIFENVPVKNIKNIKYFKEKNLIEIYFNEKIFAGEYGKFIVLSNKNNALIEKIFI